MKRFVWLFLIAFCTALAQVQPMDVPVTKQEKCGCCETPADSCGRRDCAPAPVSAQSGLVLQSAASSLRVEASKPAAVPQRSGEPFYVKFVSRPAALPAVVASVATARAASVPLFRAHCSFLI